MRCDVLQDLLMRAEMLEQYRAAVKKSLPVLESAEQKIKQLKKENAELQATIEQMRREQRERTILLLILVGVGLAGGAIYAITTK